MLKNRPGSGLIVVLIPLLMLSALSPSALWSAEGEQKWAFSAGGSIYSSPAVGPDGTIYVGSDDKKVYAIQPNGTKKWEFETDGKVISSPAVDYYAGAITIYVCSENGRVYALSPDDGTKKWEFETGGVVSSSPAIGLLGTLYVGSDDKKVYSIRLTDGKAEGGEWPFVTGGKVTSSPAIASDGTIYVGSHDNKLYAIKSTGKEKWVFAGATGIISSSPAIGSDGTIYVGSEDGYLYAIDPDAGTLKQGWPFQTGGKISSSPAVGTDGVVFVGAGDAKLYAVKSDGTQSWVSTYPDEAVRSSPAIGSDGTIYVGSDDYRVYAINSGGTEKWEFLTGGRVSSSPTIGFGGDVYVGSEDGKLYAIESSSPRLADVAWPKFHHDVRNTARNNTNAPPVSDAGSDQTVKSGDTVTLNGSNSYDPDYGIPLYTWTPAEGTSVTLSDATAVKPTFTAPSVDEETTLTFELKVTDNGAKTDTDTCTVTVQKKDDDKGCFISTAGGGVGY